MYFETIQQFTKMLTNLDTLLVKAERHAEAKKFDVNNFTTQRLAPDMFPFTRQVQIATDVAKATAAQLAGKEAPRYEDHEKTFVELHERIAKTIAYLKTFKAGDFEDCGKKSVKLSFPQGKTMLGDDFMVQRSIPNLYFHIATAYLILRQGGVDVGKGEFLGNLPMGEV